MKKKNYLNRKYYRVDSIIDSIKFFFLKIFLKNSKSYTHKIFLYKIPPRSTIKLNIFGQFFINIWYIIIFYTKLKKLPFIIENDNNNNFSSLDFFDKNEVTNPSIKNNQTSELNLEFITNIEKSYLLSIEDSNLSYKNSEWWSECIEDLKKKLFDEKGKIIVKNLDNIFQIDFKAILFELSSPIKSNRSEVQNFFSALKTINQYHDLSGIIMDGVLRSISEPEIGNSKCVIYRGQRLSERLIRHGYYASQIIKNTQFLENSNKVFLDLGGGFGSLSRILLNINKSSKCIIIEQPEISLIAAYYMKKNFPKKKIFTYFDYKNLKNKTQFFDNKDFDILILPSWCFSEIPNDYLDLTINTTSVGETSKEFGSYFLDNIERATKNYFYSNNKVNSDESIWDGYGHNQFNFKKNWFPMVYNFSYTWHLEFLGKKID